MRVQLCTAVRYFWAFLLVIFSVAIIQYNSDVPNFSFSSQSSVIKLPNDKLNFTFTYLITPDRLCQSESNDKSSIQLVVIVKSRVESSDNRQSIRETWGEVAAERNIPVIFVVAANNHSQSDLLTESHRHGDILQADLIDSYHNLSLKVLSLLAWEAERCGNGVNYYFHTDDDCIVIIPHLLDYIKRRFPVGRHNRILHGHCWIGGSKVARNQSNHKNFMPYSVFPHKWYPSHCSGTGYLMSSDVPKKLIRTIPHMDLIRDFGNNEDVLYTGVLADKAKIPRIHTEQILYHNISSLEPCYKRIISTHEYKPSARLKTGWTLLQSSYDRCESYAQSLPKA